MSKESDDEEYEKYVKDSRIPCQYGVKCYQKNPMHHNKYKHPPKTGQVRLFLYYFPYFLFVYTQIISYLH